MTSHTTSHDLIVRACNVNDESAWEEIVKLYQKFICYILVEVGIDHSSLEDLSQQVLMTLMRDLPNYDKNKGKFRNWLSTIIRNVAFGHLRSTKRRTIRNQKYGLSEEIESPTNDLQHIDDLVEEEWEVYIANMAFERIKPIFRGQAIRVFELSLDGNSAKEIARITGLSIASVYTLRKRVKKRLHVEILTITENLERE